MSVSFWLILLSMQKCTREIQRITGKAAQFETTRGYTADIVLNLSVLQGVTTGIVRRNIV